MPDKMQHDVVREGTIPRFNASLGVDHVLCGVELVKEIKRLKPSNESVFQERLADRGIKQKVVRIQFGASIAATAVHCGVCC